MKDQIIRVKGIDRVPMVLVGNKSDLEHQREVSAEEGHALAHVWGCPFLEASAKSALNVNEIFVEMVLEMNCSSSSRRKKCCRCTLL